MSHCIHLIYGHSVCKSHLNKATHFNPFSVIIIEYLRLDYLKVQIMAVPVLTCPPIFLLSSKPALAKSSPT